MNIKYCQTKANFWFLRVRSFKMVKTEDVNKGEKKERKYEESRPGIPLRRRQFLRLSKAKEGDATPIGQQVLLLASFFFLICRVWLDGRCHWERIIFSG